MKTLAREAIYKIKPYVPGKPVEEVERELGIKNVLKLASNENPLGPSPKAVEALKQSASGVNFYPDGNCFYLKEALAEKLHCSLTELIVGNGSDEVLSFITAAYLNPGEEIIMGSPSFSEYDFAAKVMGGETIKVPLINYTHDLEGMAKAVTAKTKIIFVCNPNNPTGTMVDGNQVAQFMSKVPNHVLVVFDEAYYEYVENSDYPDTLGYVREGRNVIVLRTFSKIYGLAGLRIGYGVAPEGIISDLNRVREPFNVNILSQKAALAALGDYDFLQKSKKINLEGKEMLYQALGELGLEFIPTEANFIFINAGVDSQELFKKLLQKGVIIRTGDIFNHPTFIRLTVGQEEENKRVIRALREVLEK